MSSKTNNTLPQIKAKINTITLLSFTQITSKVINVSFQIKNKSKIIHFLLNEIASIEAQNNSLYLYTSDGGIYLIIFLSNEDAIAGHERINNILNGGFF